MVDLHDSLSLSKNSPNHHHESITFNYAKILYVTYLSHMDVSAFLFGVLRTIMCWPFQLKRPRETKLNLTGSHIHWIKILLMTTWKVPSQWKGKLHSLSAKQMKRVCLHTNFFVANKVNEWTEDWWECCLLDSRL